MTLQLSRFILGIMGFERGGTELHCSTDEFFALAASPGAFAGLQKLALTLDARSRPEHLAVRLEAPCLEDLRLDVLLEALPDARWLELVFSLAAFRQVSLYIRRRAAPLDDASLDDTEDRWFARAAGSRIVSCRSIERLHLVWCRLGRRAMGVLSRSPLSALRELNLSDNLLSRSGLRHLLSAPWLAELDRLVLNSCGISDACGSLLLSAPALKTIKEISLVGNRLGAEFCRTFAATRLPALRSLSLGSNPLDDECARILATVPRPKRLENLDLSGSHIHDDGACLLAASPLLSGLESLSMGFDYGHEMSIRGMHALMMANKEMSRVLFLSSKDLGDPDLALLAQDRRLMDFEGLNLCFNSVGAVGVAALASSPCSAGLRYLNFMGTRFDAEAAHALASSPHLAGLEKLSLQFCSIGDRGLLSLLLGPYASSLRELDLSDCGLSADEIRGLAAASLPELSTLLLNDNAIGDEGALALASASGLPKLCSLYLGNNGITDRGAHALLTSPLLEGVEQFFLFRNDISDSFVEKYPASSRVSYGHVE